MSRIVAELFWKADSKGIEYLATSGAKTRVWVLQRRDFYFSLIAVLPTYNVIILELLTQNAHKHFGGLETVNT